MKRTRTIIGVKDVLGSFKWYQSLLGRPEATPAQDLRLGRSLHQWGSHDHPSLMDPDTAQPGNGLLLFFSVDDFDMALRRARGFVSRLDEEPDVNPATGTRELALRNSDGYYVMVSALI